MAKLRAVLMEVTLQTLDRAFGLPPGMHIEEVITEPANRYNRTRLLVVSGTHEMLPEVEEGALLKRAEGIFTSQGAWEPPTLQQLKILE